MSTYINSFFTFLALSYSYIHYFWPDCIFLNAKFTKSFQWSHAFSINAKARTPALLDSVKESFPPNPWPYNNVVITSKPHHSDIITSKWCRLDVITTSLLRNVCWDVPKVERSENRNQNLISFEGAQETIPCQLWDYGIRKIMHKPISKHMCVTIRGNTHCSI